MRKTIIESQQVEVEIDIVCDSCGRDSDIESIEAGEFLKIDFRGGFGSVFGDGCGVTADICQVCLKQYLGQFLKITQPQG